MHIHLFVFNTAGFTHQTLHGVNSDVPGSCNNCSGPAHITYTHQLKIMKSTAGPFRSLKYKYCFRGSTSWTINVSSQQPKYLTTAQISAPMNVIFALDVPGFNNNCSRAAHIVFTCSSKITLRFVNCQAYSNNLFLCS